MEIIDTKIFGFLIKGTGLRVGGGGGLPLKK